MQETEHKYARVVSNTIISMDTPADLANATSISHDDAEKIGLLAMRRAEARPDGRVDVIIAIEPWAKTYPSRSDPIADSSVLLVGEVTEYSEKAYKCRGAVWVRMDELEDMTLEDVSEIDTVELIDYPNEHETNPGLKFLPKSAVDAIAVMG